MTEEGGCIRKGGGQGLFEEVAFGENQAKIKTENAVSTQALGEDKLGHLRKSKGTLVQNRVIRWQRIGKGFREADRSQITWSLVDINKELKYILNEERPSEGFDHMIWFTI